MVGVQGILASKKEYRENVLFLPVDIDGIDNLEQLIIKHFNTMFRLHNKRMDEITTELQEKISKIFKGLDLTFNFSHLDTDDQVYFKNKQGQEFPTSNLSTGEKTLLSKILYLALYNVKNKIILIDEPELSLHPIWQEKVLGIYEAFAKRNNNQIIIATHSPHIIGSAKNEYIRILREVDGKIEVINDVTAYGRDIQWVLKEVMGSQYTRSKTITDKLEYCQTLLNDEKYNEVEQCINNLEARIGNDDNDIMDLRNSLFFERD
jgi:predicted ATP-binding protein involved in virulence